MKQCGLSCCLYRERGQKPLITLVLVRLPAWVTGEPSVVLRAANKRVIVWMYPLLCPVFPGPPEKYLVLVTSQHSAGQHNTVNFRQLCFLPGGENVQEQSFSAFREIPFSGCRRRFLVTGNLQDPGRLCREGEDYSQELIRQWVPRLAQCRPRGFQSSSFLSAKGCRKISTAEIRLVILTILLSVITGFLGVFWQI